MKILSEIKHFYENLYNNQHSMENFDNHFLSDVKKLDKKVANDMEKELQMEECEKALKKMKNGKTPGSDGLSVEFYKIFWQHIKDLVYESFIYGYNIGELSIDQKRGIIKLLPKKGKILKFLKNWRPISLLNTDYKILAHVLAMRLQSALPSIIHPDQNGYLENCFIRCNIRTIYDIIELSQFEPFSNIITLVDYEKAFDNIKWTFLQKSLEAFGFSKNFRNWINVMYSGSKSCVMNNGYSSTFFSLSNGVHQGCPLSALLFIIVVETLAENIRNDKNIKGVKVNNEEVKISLLADDTTLFLKDIDSLRKVLNTMEMFMKCSGLKINKNKTQILQVGKKDWDTKEFKLKSAKHEIYTLGTWFYKDPQITNKSNITNKINDFEGILEYWKHKHLTIFEKIKVLKVFALSKLNYVITNLDVDKDDIERIQKSIFEFVWENKPPKIKYDVSFQDIENGGIKLPHTESFINANRISWVKRLLYKHNRSHQYLQSFIPHIPLEHFLKCNFNPQNLPINIPSFYLKILCTWFDLKKEPKNALDVRREFFMLNQHIKIDNNYVFYPEMLTKNILSIHDLLNKNGHFFSYTSFCAKNGAILNPFQYMSLIDAIPLRWRSMLKQQNIPQAINISEEPLYCSLENNEINIHKLKSNYVYWHIIKKMQRKPTCIESWNKRLNITLDTTNWKSIFCLPHQCTNNLEIKDLQIKIIHRFYASQSLISKWDKETSNICKLCNTKDANILHTFYECQHSTDFWTDMQGWINEHDPFQDISFNKITVILGIVPYTFRTHCINHMILHAKHFIHVQRTYNKRPKRTNFLNSYKYTLITEKELFTLKGQSSMFQNLFGKIFQYLFFHT